jgi:hypothetical protein
VGQLGKARLDQIFRLVKRCGNTRPRPAYWAGGLSAGSAEQEKYRVPKEITAASISVAAPHRFFSTTG